MITTWLEIGLSNALVATVLAALAFVCTRRMRPQWAFAVWLLVLAKLLVPPVWNAPLGSLRTLLPPDETVAGIDWLADSDANRLIASPTDRLPPVAADLSAFDLPATAIEAIPLEPTPMASASRWLAPSLACVWVAGTGLWITLSLGRIRRFKLLLRRARRAPARLQEEVRILADQLGLKRVPEVRVARRRVSPLVWALFGRPTILLPAGLLRKLTRPQRTALLLHELAHLRRRDHWTKLVELAAITVYWWLPTAWLARRHADRAAEHCCDALVVAHSPAVSRAYAEALLLTIDFLSPTPTPLPLGASGFSQFGQVSRRIEMILRPQPHRRRNLISCLILVVAGTAVLPLSVRTLWAEPAPSPEQTKSAASDAETKHEARATEPESEDLPGDPAGPQGGEFVEGEAGKDWITRHQVNSLKVEKELVRLVRDQHLAAELVKTHFNRREAASKQLRAMQRAYDNGTVTLDQLLEAQRRMHDTKRAYAGAVCGLSTDPDRRKLLLAEARLNIANDSLQEARKTWKSVYDISRGGDQEAQAREQFYQFKQEAQRALAEYLLIAPPKAKGKLSANTAGPYPVVRILGPLTADGPIRALDPPSDGEVLRATDRFTARMIGFPESLYSSVRKSVRIVKEKVAEYTDPPRFYPLIGRGQLHHVHYKCSIFSQSRDGKEREEVVEVDHNHFHVAPETSDARPRQMPPGSRIDSGSELIQNIGYFIGSQR